MDQNGYENLREMMINHVTTQKIVVWGGSYKSDAIIKTITDWGYTIDGIVDRNSDEIGEYAGYPVYAVDYLQDHKCFVYVALRGDYPEVVKTLELYGYREFVDYWYPARLISLDGTYDYSDKYGNELITSNRVPISVKLRDGAKIEIYSQKINSTLKILSQGAAKVTIGENAVFGENISIAATNGIIYIGSKCRINNFVSFRVSSGGTILMGNKCSIQKQCTLVASFHANLIMGADCMVSYFVLMRAGNSHNMIDLDTLTHLDDNTCRDVVLGEHVWVGMGSTLLNGVEIGSGSTIGANSFVCKKKFPNNCCLAGNPAKILRKRTAWIRDGISIHRDLADYEDYIYESEKELFL